VDVAARVQVALVDLEPTLNLVVFDPDNLDAEIAREAARDAFAEALRGDGGVRQAAVLSRCAPSS
jgi:hypothetical protein